MMMCLNVCIYFILFYAHGSFMVEGMSDSDISDIRIMLHRLNETITGMASFVAETNNRLNIMDGMIHQRNRISISNGSSQKVSNCF